MADAPSDDLPLSAILRELSALDRDTTFDELIERFGGRAFGAIIFVFGLACALPLPPGSSTVLGAPLVLLTPQMALGRHAPWLPRRVGAHPIPARDLRRICERLLPWLERIERVSRPRLGMLLDPLGERMIGVVCTLLSLVLILPIPLGNLLPAMAVAAFALALILRDGLLALAGYALTAASTAVLVLAAHVIIGGLRQVLALIAAA
jgi:hypothetical protein